LAAIDRDRAYWQDDLAGFDQELAALGKVRRNAAPGLPGATKEIYAGRNRNGS
jgi:hypothetical protein